MSACTQDVLDRELERFFTIDAELQERTGAAAKMPVCIVDDHWHALIESGTINEFVTSRFGDDVCIEHIESAGAGQLDWISLYEREFGPLDPTWFTGERGLDTDAYARYQAGEPLRFAWKCDPYRKPTSKPKGKE